jgi:hypothetical protein
MNATQTEAKEQYIQSVQRFIQVDEDKHGRLVCFVPSKSNPEGLEDGAWHTVQVDDETTTPSPYHCSCEAFQYNKTRSCRHQEAVAVFYARIYKSTVVKQRIAKISAEVEAVKAATAKHNTPEEFDAACQDLREMKSLKVGQPGSVALTGKSASNWTETAALNGSRSFSMLK